MTENELMKVISSIEGRDKEAEREAAERQESLAKPPGSLGYLEDISVKMAGITGNIKQRRQRMRCGDVC